jgi:hypothetical protein
MKLRSAAEVEVVTNKWGKVREALHRDDVDCLYCLDDVQCADTADFGPGTVCV